MTPPPVSKMLEFASSQNLSFLNLEHRNMLAAPLAALHTMTEMKSQQNLHTAAQHHMFPGVGGIGTLPSNMPNMSMNNMSSSGNLVNSGAGVGLVQSVQQQQQQQHVASLNSSGGDKTQQETTESMLDRSTNIHVERSGLGSQRGSPLGATTNSNSSQGANPHGIDHILSRPSQITTGHLHFPASLGFTQNSLAMASNPAHQTTSNSGLRGFNIAAAAFFHHHAANSVSKAPVDLGRTSGGIYWPGFQGLVANPMAWRDRLNTSKL